MVQEPFKSELDYFELEPNDTLAVGEKVWLIQYRKPRIGKIVQKNVDGFSDSVEKRLVVEVAYCSAIRENICWSRCSIKGRCE